MQRCSFEFPKRRVQNLEVARGIRRPCLPSRARAAPFDAVIRPRRASSLELRVHPVVWRTVPLGLVNVRSSGFTAGFLGPTRPEHRHDIRHGARLLKPGLPTKAREPRESIAEEGATFRSATYLCLVSSGPLEESTPSKLVYANCANADAGGGGGGGH